MNPSRILAMLMLLSMFAANDVEGRPQEPNKVGSATIKGKVFRSDSSQGISNSYILTYTGKRFPRSGGAFRSQNR